MSHVSNVVLMGQLSEESELPDIGLKRADGFAGGTKKMENPVYLAGVNYLDTEELVKWFQGYAWIDPAVLIIQTESGPIKVLNHEESY